MIVFGVPGFLLAGLLAALVPLALHLIRRRPPSRGPLPTARFLSEDARTSVRAGRPTDVPLLLLRMLLVALAGAALARPAWVPAARGATEVVLLDRGAGYSPAEWARAVEAARGVLLDSAGRARGALVLFDTASRTVAPGELDRSWFDALAAAPPAGAGTRYGAGLRGLHQAARALRGADSVRATLVSPFRRGGWDDGLPAVRRAAWPGAIRLVEVAVAGPPDLGSPTARPRRAVVMAAGGEGRFVTAALGATGWDVERAPESGGAPAGADAYFVLSGAPPRHVAPLVAEARRGATVVLAGAAAPADASPWEAAADTLAPGGQVRFDGGLRLEGVARRQAGRPAPGARALAAWDDGRIAAAALSVGGGCLVHFAAGLEDGELPLSPAFPRALDRLARGCEATASDPETSLPLDAGARAVLRGEGAENVAAGAFARREGGTALGRWAMAAALLVALVETGAAYSRRGRA